MNASRHDKRTHHRFRTGTTLLTAAIVAFCAALGVPQTTHAQADEASGDAADHSGPQSLGELLTAFRGMEGLEASFEEEKHIGMLAAPLRSSGVLYFSTDGYLLRRIVEPQRMDVLVTPDELRITEEGTTQEVDLSSRQDVARFVTAFMWLLSGDEDQLQSAYEMSFTTDDDGAGWNLVLTPTDEELRYIIATISVSGRGYYVRQIRVTEGNGDETLTRITEANPDRTFDAAERRDLFGLP